MILSVLHSRWRSAVGVVGVLVLVATLVVAAGVAYAQTLPQLSINSINAQEGSTTDPDTETDRVVEFVFRLSPTINEDVEVGFNFAGPFDSSQPAATEGDDFTSPSSSVTIPANSSSVRLQVTIRDDFLDEDTEHFRLIPSVSSNAALSDSLAHYYNDDPQEHLFGHWATGSITDNDGLPALMLTPEDDSVTERGRTLRYQLSLSEPSGRRVVVKYEILSGLKRVDSNNKVTDLPDNPCSSFTDNQNACKPATPYADYEPFGDQTWNDNGTPDDTTDDVLSGEFVFEPGETRVSPDSSVNHPEISINIVEETGPNLADRVDVDDRDETVTLRLLPDPSFAFATDDDRFAHGLILDDDLPRVSLNQWGTGPEIEGDSTIGVRISPVVPTGGDPVEVKYRFVSGVSVEPVSPDLQLEDGGPQAVECTAEEGSDYTKKHTGDFGTLTFGPNETQKQITYTRIDDTVSESDERVCVQLFEVSNHALLELHPYLYDTLIDNDDPPNFEILADPEAAEDDRTNGGRLTFRVRLNEPSDTDPTSVAYETVDGTAEAGVDYVHKAGTLTFKAGTGPETLDVAVTLLLDDLDESNETLSLVLRSGTETRAEATGTIIDNDGTPRLSVAPATVEEDHDAPNGTVDFRVTLAGRSSQPVTVGYDTGIAGDTATEGTTCATGVDYIATTGGLVWAAGQTGSQTISVPICDDDAYEGDETFTLKLSDPLSAEFARQATTITATGTIDDDERPPSFSVADSTNAEDDGYVDFEVTLASQIDSDVTVDYETAVFISGSDRATEGADCSVTGADYDDASDTVTFPAGSVSETVSVPICPDNIDEFDETFKLTLSNPSDDIPITRSTATGTIEDSDDPPDLTFQNEDVAVDEDAGTIDFVVRLGVVSGRTSAKRITVRYATADGTATSPADFAAAPANAALTFAPGVTSQTISLQVKNDALDEADTETFTLELSSPDNATLDSDPLTATGTINDDDDLPSLSFRRDVTASESAGSMTFTVVLSARSARTVEVLYSTADDTATAGADYTALTSETLQFKPGDPLTKNITVEILNDVLDEADSETFTLELHDALNAQFANEATSVSATGTITDNDAATAEVRVANVSATEGGTVTFDVTLTTAKDTEVTVSYQTVADSAHTATGGTDCSAAGVEAGVDFARASGTVTFDAQQTTTADTIDVTTCADSLDEPTETFGLRLTSSDVTTPSELATASIFDDNDPPSLSVDDPAAVEDAGHVEFAVTLDAVSAKTVTVAYETRDGTATATGTNRDYTRTTGTLTFAPGEDEKTVRVPIRDDSTDEEHETFTLELLSTPAPVNATIGTGSGLATITDDEEPGLEVNNPPTVRESAGKVTFTVTLEPASIETVTVRYDTMDGTATQPDDYTTAGDVLTFTPGQTTKTVDVIIISDSTSESDEKFTLVLSNPTPSDVPLYDAIGEATITERHGGGGSGSGSGGDDGGGDDGGQVITQQTVAPRIGVFLQDVVLVLNEPPLQIDLVASIAGAIDTYRALAANPRIVTVITSGATLTLAPEALGVTTVSVSASNSRGAAFQAFRVTVIERGSAPKFASPLPDRVLYVGDPPQAVDVSSAFTGTVTSYAATAGDPNLVSVSITGSHLSLTGLAPGVTTVTVSAINAHGVAMQSFRVTVLIRQALGTRPGPLQEIPTH